MTREFRARTRNQTRNQTRGRRSRTSRRESKKSGGGSRAGGTGRTRRGGGAPSALASVFKSSDFDSKNGFLTSVWGPSLWFVLHIISLNYATAPSVRQRREYQAFFDSLKHVLPCGICRENLGKNLKCTGYGPHVFKNRATLSKFVHKLHNCVNGMLGKDKCEMSYHDMRKMYENFRARCSLTHSSKNSSKRGRKHSAGEGGCTDPVTGVKSKCTLRIVPIDYCANSMEIDKRCIMRKC